MRRRWAVFGLILLVLAPLGACSGGDPAPESEWDRAIWDRAEWK